MLREPKTIDVEPGSEIADLLDEAVETPLLLVMNGVRFRLDRDEADIWAGYDPERARAGMRAAAGRLTVEDAERLKEYIYRGREEGTRPIDRPRPTRFP